MVSIDSVAVIGIGVMGEQAVRHFGDGGFEVYAYDVDEAAMDHAEELGATRLDSPGEGARRADASFILVGTTDQVDDVIFGEGGIVARADGSDHVIAISSTVSPEYCTDVGERVTEPGLTVVDVPTCRGEKAAERGDLLVFAGGDEATCEALGPLLECLGAPENVVYLGALGNGQVGKAANNTLLWVGAVANYEVLKLATAYGIDPDELREVLTRSTGDNWSLRNWGWMHTKWAHKDLDIVTGMAVEKDSPMPLTGAAYQLASGLTTDEIDETR